MRVAASSALYLLLAGCGFTVPSDDRVSLIVERASIGTSVRIAPDDVAALAAAFLVEDPGAPLGTRRIPAEHIGASGWGADLPSPLPLEFQIPEPSPVPHVFDLGVVHAHGLFPVLEHAGPHPAPSGSILAVTVTLDHAVLLGESFQVLAVGPWESIGLAASIGAQSLATTFAHDMMNSNSDTGHVAIASDDAVFALRYAGPTLTGMVQAAAFDETGADNIAGAMLPVALDRTLGIAVTRDADVTRLTTTKPALGQLGASWSLWAAPGAEVAMTNGPQLSAGGLGPLATTIAAAYGDPFPWAAVVYYQASGTRTATIGGLPVTAVGGMYVMQPATASGSISLSAPMPLMVSLDGVPLATDGAMLPRPMHPVVVELTTDRAGEGVLFVMQMFELVPNTTNTALTYVPAAEFQARVPRFIVPAERFVPGKQFLMRVTAFGAGYDGAAVAGGDLTARSMPFAAGYFDAGVFGVQ